MKEAHDINADEYAMNMYNKIYQSNSRDNIYFLSRWVYVGVSSPEAKLSFVFIILCK